MKTVKILDTTLRDGEQSPGCSMNLQEKIEMAQQLERLGVDIIEAGFPTTSPEDFEAVKKIAGTIKGGIGDADGTVGIQKLHIRHHHRGG